MKRLLRPSIMAGLFALLMATAPLAAGTAAAEELDIPIGPSASVCVSGQCFQTVKHVHLEWSAADPDVTVILGGTTTPDCDLLNWDGTITTSMAGRVDVALVLTMKDGAAMTVINQAVIVPPGSTVGTFPGTSLCVDQG